METNTITAPLAAVARACADRAAFPGQCQQSAAAQPSPCAPWLAFSAAATAFGPGIRSTIVGTGVRYLLPAGAMLFDGLARLLLAPEYQSPSVGGDAASSVWTWHPEAVGDSERHAVSYLEALVFPCRAFRLIPEAASITCSRCGSLSTFAVREVVMKRGWYSYDEWIDPFVAYYRMKKGGLRPLVADERVPSWQALASMFADRPLERGMRPLVVEQLVDLLQRGALGATSLLEFRCAGLVVNDKASTPGLTKRSSFPHQRLSILKWQQV